MPNDALLAIPRAAELRTQLRDMVVRDLLGPAGGSDEEIDERNVRDRYLVGMLAPRRRRPDNEPAPDEQDELPLEENAGPEEGPVDRGARGSMFPSSIGMSFCVPADVRNVHVTVRWGRYERTESESLADDEGKPRRVWKRTPVEGSRDVALAEGTIEPVALCADQPEVFVRGAARRRGEDVVVTLFLVNDQEEPPQSRDVAWLFQPELIVEGTHGDRTPFRRRPALGAGEANGSYDELRAMDMLYRQRVEFAAGHGCAVRVELAEGDPTRASRISTVAVPSHEVEKMSPPRVEDEPALRGLVLDMKALAEMDPERLPTALAPLTNAYETWIAGQRRRAEDGADGLAPFGDIAEASLLRCDEALRRIREGIALLQSDRRAAEAFRFANRAMWLQRVRTRYAEEVRRGETPDLSAVDVPAQRTWFPFQLAFVLQSLPGLTQLDHRDRTDESAAVADLLWFPTGGGKTEAYLGLAAYTMALRRLQGVVEGREGDHGVAVLMRYTLRVLTLQQFQRAAALLCACEVIRKEAAASGDTRWGDEPFRIGLWVGYRTTPNRTDQSAESLRQERGQARRMGVGSRAGSPAQLESCPWCGAKIEPGRHMRAEPAPAGAGRTFTFCGDDLGACPFTESRAPGEGLPVVVVDEEIYRLLPSMVVATVDKFAQMPWNGLVQTLFGRVDGQCPRHGFRSPAGDETWSHPASNGRPAVIVRPHGLLRPPDLIIQDELHLISGPLGTLTALYETAIDELCTWIVGGRRVRPKVVASTATIRRAPAQVNGLFLRKVEVFPPHGLDASDSFFARARPVTAEPGRLYLGICAPGRRLKAALIRTYVALLASGQALYERYGVDVDPWMTLVGYFNSIRELAGMRRLVDDDVRSRLRDTDRRGLASRRPPVLEELTSRIPSSKIKGLLDRMEVRFDPAAARATGAPKALDVLLATNMISVGVDVKRLGLMAVAGQPKTTAEYIQATSRVGRSSPGLVCTVYNWARPRDLSHYERFEHYHATFYQHVEATSVTPFSPRALDRGLSAVFVALVRLAGLELSRNGAAQAVTRDHPLVVAALDRIARRAELVTGRKSTGDDVRALLDRRLDEWLRKASDPGGARVGYEMSRDGITRGLLKEPGIGGWDDFTCLMSLRDVEPSVNLVLDEGAMDDEPVGVAS